MNLANRSYDRYRIGLPRPGLWKVRFNSDWTGYGADFAGHPSDDTSAEGGPYDGMPCSGNVGIGRYSAIILSQDTGDPVRSGAAGRVRLPGDRSARGPSGRG